MASHSTTTTTTTTRTHVSGPTQTTTTQTSYPQAGPQSRNALSQATSTSSQPAIQTMDDHPRPEEMGHGHGETSEQHAVHASYSEVPDSHWGLPARKEEILFYCFFIPSICLEIVAGILGSYYASWNKKFIPCITVFFVLSAAAWGQTVVQMLQRASWVRDESNLVERRRFLYLAVRLNRMMLPTAVIAFPIFVVGYVRRRNTNDIGNWLIFQLIFIINVVFSVMNAYNNITWESDRLEYEEGSSPYGNTLMAFLGIPSKPRKSVSDEE